MKVLIINRWFGHKMGGVEIHARRIIAGLLEKGHEVSLLTSGTTFLHDLPESVTVYQVKSKQGYYSLMTSGLFYAIGYVVRATALACRLRKQGRTFDCVLSLFTLDSFAARWIRLLCSWPYSALATENSILEVIETRRADVPAFITEYMVDLCRARDLAPDIVHPAIDITRWTPIEDNEYQNKASSTALQMVSVGRLDARKDPQLLIRSVACLKDAGIPFELHVCGNGDLKEQVTKDIADLGLSEMVHLLDSLSDNALADLYRRGHIFVMTSRFEGFGRVYVEAMASGLPVVVTEGGATESVIGDGGIVIHERNPNVIAAAITELWQDKKRLCALRKKALSRATEHSFEKHKDEIGRWAQRVSQVSTGTGLRRLAVFLRGAGDIPIILKMIAVGGAVRWSSRKPANDLGRGRIGGELGKNEKLQEVG